MVIPAAGWEERQDISQSETVIVEIKPRNGIGQMRITVPVAYRRNADGKTDSYGDVPIMPDMRVFTLPLRSLHGKMIREGDVIETVSGERWLIVNPGSGAAWDTELRPLCALEK